MLLFSIVLLTTRSLSYCKAKTRGAARRRHCPKGRLRFYQQQAHTSWKTFEVPRSFRGNKEFMMAACAKWPNVFDQAAKRLQDDVDLVRIALLEENASSRNIQHVSKRLRTDTTMLLYAVTMGYCTPSFAWSWMKSLQLKIVIKNRRKSLAPSYAAYPSIALMVAAGTWLSCPSSRRSYAMTDAGFMLPFVEFNWKALRWCSVRLRSNMWHMEVVRAAVSKNINTYQYTDGPVLEAYSRQRTSALYLMKLSTRS
jgi:hypothetical protein